MYAVTRLESIPPERNVPTGTSAMRRLDDRPPQLLLDHLGERASRLALERREPFAVHQLGRVEPAPLLGLERVEVDGEQRSRQDALDPLERRRAAVRPAVDDGVGDDVAQGTARHTRGEERAHLAREPQAPVVARPVHRLDPPAVAREQQASPLQVERRKPEEAVEARQGGLAPAREGLEHAFRVGMPAPRCRLELPAQLEVVEDLAVVGQPPAAGRMSHRLVAGGGGIDDREPAVHQPDVALDRDSLVVRAAVRERRAHPLESLAVGRLARRRHATSDAAHRPDATACRGADRVAPATRGGALGLDPSRLKSIPLFEKFSDEELSQIAPFAEEATAEQGAVLVREGDYSYQFVAIEDGTARVTRDGDTVAELGPGDFFGEIGLLEKSFRTATVEATSPMKLITLTGWDMARVEKAMPEAIEELHKAIEERRPEGDG